MLKGERQQQILTILKEADGFVSVGQLCETLYASESSIRRDLCRMEQQGLVKRTYGGAEAVTNPSGIPAFDYRYGQNAAAKREIAEKAVTLIKDGSVIFLDQSSTAFCLAAVLPNKSSLTVITNNIEIMCLLSKSNINVIASGGQICRANRTCLVGADAQQIFEATHADIAFFSCKALTADGTIYDYSREEVTTRGSILRNAEKIVFLCDSGKFSRNAPYKQCTLSDVDYLISEGNAAAHFAEKFKGLSVL
jgi:DeoR/GlpR family transcriptional regulator of sugar metabolism